MPPNRNRVEMHRSFFKTLAVGLAVLAGCAAVAFAAIAGIAARTAPESTVRAIAIARDLARDWSLDTIRPRYAAVAAARLDATGLQERLDDISSLGRLIEVVDARQTDFSIRFHPSDGFVATATIVLEGLYERGDARIVMTLRLESGATLLQSIAVEPTVWYHRPRPPPARHEPRGFA